MVTKSDKELKTVNQELNKKVDEATEINARRDRVAQEARTKSKVIREVTTKMKEVSRNINELESQKKVLEKARDECIMA